MPRIRKNSHKQKMPKKCKKIHTSKKNAKRCKKIHTSKEKPRQDCCLFVKSATQKPLQKRRAKTNKNVMLMLN
jgi:hypothetical protein